MSKASIGLASPTFGALSGAIGKTAEQIALAIARAGGYVRLLGNPTRLNDSEFVGPSEELPVSGIISLLDPSYWLRSLQPTVGIVATPDGEMHPNWGDRLRQVDTVVCPSEWTRDVAAGVDDIDPVLVPFGVDPYFAQPKLRERGDRLRVLFFAGDVTNPRKGFDVAIAAFTAAFADRDDVELVVHSSRPRLLNKDDHRVCVSMGPLTAEKFLELYRSCDVLLYTSRAEAFAHIALEGLATGMPVIHSGATGMADFADLGLTVPSRPVPAYASGPRVWCEPDHDALVDRLREVDANYDAVMAQAQRDAQTVASRYSWDAAVASLVRFIQR